MAVGVTQSATHLATLRLGTLGNQWFRQMVAGPVPASRVLAKIYRLSPIRLCVLGGVDRAGEAGEFGAFEQRSERLIIA